MELLLAFLGGWWWVVLIAVAAVGGVRCVQEQRRRLRRLSASHDAVTARWLEYELDVAKQIAFPALSDGRRPLTVAFLHAKSLADSLRPASTGALMRRGRLNAYCGAVMAYEAAFASAERAARLADGSNRDAAPTGGAAATGRSPQAAGSRTVRHPDTAPGRVIHAKLRR